LLLPYEDRTRSLEFLNARTGWPSEGRNANRTMLAHKSNYELARLTVYTAERNPQQIADEIIERVALAREAARTVLPLSGAGEFPPVT
jgi:hypothetical protein